MARHNLIAGAIVFGLLLGPTEGLQEMMEKAGLRKRSGLPRTVFPGDPACHPNVCPDPWSPQWSYLHLHCCQPLNMYFHCQKTDGGDVMSFCMESVLCPPGTFADLVVIRLRRYKEDALCQPCPSLQFQPEATESFMFPKPECHHRRKLCHSLNADNVRKGSATADDVCKCAHYRGYRPVLRPGHDCFTFDSSSGCKCQYKPCPKGQTMTAKGYQCLESSLAEAMDAFDDTDSNLHTESIHQEPAFCVEEDCSRPSSSSDATSWLDRLSGIHRSYGLMILTVMTVVLYVAYRGAKYIWLSLKKGPVRYDIMVCISIPSAKICELVFDELQNSLPLLERLYGPLTLDHDAKFRHITVIVRPGLASQKFHLLQFIKDLLSPVSVTKHLNGTKQKVQVVALHGSSSDVKKMSFKDAVVKQRRDMAINSGEVVLRFAQGVDETAILRELAATKRDLRSIFSGHDLKFTGVRKGSIKFRFTLPHDAQVFDSLAVEGRIREFVKDLCSCEPFNQLTKREDVQLEFLCKAQVNGVAVIQAENLIVQIGSQNNVYIGDHQAQPVGDNQDVDPLEYEEELVGDCHVDLAAFNIVSFSPRRQAIVEGQQSSEDDNELGDPGDPKPEVTQVVIKCDAATAETLHKEWTNLLPLLKRIWPNCKLRKGRTKVWWELRQEKDSFVNVARFINDIFITDRLRLIKEQHQVEVDVPMTVNNAGSLMLSKSLRDELIVERKMDGLLNVFIRKNVAGCFMVILLFGFLQSGILNWPESLIVSIIYFIVDIVNMWSQLHIIMFTLKIILKRMSCYDIVLFVYICVCVWNVFS